MLNLRMARFIPDVALSDIAHNSERIVYEALRGLSDEFVVLHSFPWLRLDRDFETFTQREGEADFVILHPQRGLLVLEVKGGQPEVSARTWYRSGKKMKDPFIQASTSRYHLLEEIEKRTNKTIKRGMFAHGDLVVFPHCRFSGELPLNINPSLVVDAPSMSSLPARVAEAFQLWASTKNTNLTTNQFQTIIEVLTPILKAQQSEAAQLSSETKRMCRLTRAQIDTLEGLLANKRVLVDGNAGSGKTLLALEFALTLAWRGEHVLLLCFNKHLSGWLKDKASKHPLHSPNKLEISTFHSYALQLGRKAGLSIEFPAKQTKDERDQDFWDTEAPQLIERALASLREKGDPLSYDAIIVDEGQDFHPSWWKPLENLSQSKGISRLYVFLDMKQSLREVAELPPIEFSACLPLKTNCRNTKAIARTGAALAQLEVRLNPDLPAGTDPKIVVVPTKAHEAKMVLSELQLLLNNGISPSQIALIGPAGLRKGSLKNFTEVNGVPLTDNAESWRHNKGILVTTTRSFKGLEADVVIIYGLGSFDKKYFTKTDLYVAWTRARLRLTLFCMRGEAYDTIQAALAAAESEASVANSVTVDSIY